MSDEELSLGQLVYGAILSGKDSEEARGFDDAIRWFASGKKAPMKDFHDPPKGLDGCRDCENTWVTLDSDCPRCQYELGFTEGNSK